MADEGRAALAKLAGFSEANFAHRVSLVEGEIARIDGDVESARQSFDRAAKQAHTGGWVNDVALANELAARCERDPASIARRLRAARIGYVAWGATVKAREVAERMGHAASER